MDYLVETRSEFGMKVVTRDNWLMPDRSALFTSSVKPGSVSDVEALIDVGGYFAERFTKIRPSKDVSEEIMRLFTVAKGAVVYGVFFYPLLEIGLERAYTSVEMAVKECVAAHGGSNRLKKSHQQCVDWLCRFGWICRDLCIELHGTRYIRNKTKHGRQSILMPIDVSRTLYGISDTLTKLAGARDMASPLHSGEYPEHEHRRLPWLE